MGEAVADLYKMQQDGNLACVYAVFCQQGDVGVIKVGQSAYPLSRIVTVVQGNPFPPIRVGVAEAGDRQDATLDEASLHRRLVSKRSRGEWFKFDLADPKQKAEFEQYCDYGFSGAWTTFPYSELREDNHKRAAKAAAIRQSKQRSKSKSLSDNLWRGSDERLDGFWMPRGRVK